MELTNTEETINFPVKQWDGWSNPTLEFMLAQGFTEIIPDPPTIEEQASTKISALELEIASLANEKISGHIDLVEISHYLGVAEALSRQHSLWMEECLSANIEERMPDEVTYPPLTTEEHMIWFSLSLVQSSTAPVRDAARAIIASLYQMTSEDILALPSDWVSTHVLWP